jgi:hypothetical protein
MMRLPLLPYEELTASSRNLGPDPRPRRSFRPSKTATFDSSPYRHGVLPNLASLLLLLRVLL